jgi:hypothetical protein
VHHGGYVIQPESIDGDANVFFQIGDKFHKVVPIIRISILLVFGIQLLLRSKCNKVKLSKLFLLSFPIVLWRVQLRHPHLVLVSFWDGADTAPHKYRVV